MLLGGFRVWGKVRPRVVFSFFNLSLPLLFFSIFCLHLLRHYRRLSFVLTL